MTEAMRTPPPAVRRSTRITPGSSLPRPDIPYGQLRKTVMQSILSKSAIASLAGQDLNPSIEKKVGTFYSWPADMQQAETAGCLLAGKGSEVPETIHTAKKGALVFMFQGFAVRSQGIWVRATQGSSPTPMAVTRNVANKLKATVTEKAGQINPTVEVSAFPYCLQPPGGQNGLDALVKSGDAVPSPFVNSNPASTPKDIRDFYELIMPEDKRREEIVIGLAHLVAVHDAMRLG